LNELSLRTQDPATRANLQSFHDERAKFYDADGPRVRTGREIKEVPREIQAIATRSGGLNLYGEPNYRIVWGWSRLALIGGEWTDLDAHGDYYQTVGQYRWEPKYLPYDRFHLERWLPPSHFVSKEYWYEISIEEFNGQEFAALGPFPSRGEYEACYVFQNADGSYQDLFPYVVETVCRALNYQRAMRDQERRAALDRREAKKVKDFDDFAVAVVDDAMPAYYGKTNVNVPVNTSDLERSKK
jgi:hypothetical protein